MLKNLTDEELVSSILTVTDNKPFMEELYNRYEKQVYYKCMLLSGDKVFAKDLTQEVFIKVFTKLNTYRGDSKFKYWILRVTHNSCLNFLRKKKTAILFENIEEESEDAYAEDPEESTEYSVELLKEALKELDPQEVYLLNLKYAEGMKVHEIAKVLEIKESAVKMRLKRLRERLSTILKPHLS
ncbi:MAG: sigma-70 family RNA polymerase sigma factor [Saprospiraceae bacterium]|nr:sigma-70 family RNA polymerase sigma factor [Saprospiraceae bacterium]